MTGLPQCCVASCVLFFSAHRVHTTRDVWRCGGRIAKMLTSLINVHVTTERTTRPVSTPCEDTVVWHAKTRAFTRDSGCCQSLYCGVNNKRVAHQLPGKLDRLNFIVCKTPRGSLPSRVEQGLTSHKTHYRSYRGRVFTCQMTQPTVSKH